MFDLVCHLVPCQLSCAAKVQTADLTIVVTIVLYTSLVLVQLLVVYKGLEAKGAHHIHLSGQI